MNIHFEEKKSQCMFAKCWMTCLKQFGNLKAFQTKLSLNEQVFWNLTCQTFLIFYVLFCFRSNIWQLITHKNIFPQNIPVCKCSASFANVPLQRKKMWKEKIEICVKGKNASHRIGIIAFAFTRTQIWGTLSSSSSLNHMKNSRIYNWEWFDLVASVRFADRAVREFSVKLMHIR